MMDKYIRKARVYPAIIGLVPISILLAMCMNLWFPHCQVAVGNVKWLISLTIGSAVVVAAVGFFIRDVFRETAKILFETRVFKEDKSEMPTTKLLLWKNKHYSKEVHDNISAKVKEVLDLHLPSEEEELQDLDEAKRTIVHVVDLMLADTRGDMVLRQYNIEYGFCRNYLGACVWSLGLIVLFGGINIFFNWLPCYDIVIAFVLQLGAMGIIYLFLERRGWAFARVLIRTFMNKHK